MHLIKSIILFVLLTSKIYAGSLNCSASGTIVFHIPGSFTSKAEQSGAETKLKSILTDNPLYFDLKSQEAQLIPIASQGILQDKFNYFLNSLGTTGDAAWLVLGATEFGYQTAGSVMKFLYFRTEERYQALLNIQSNNAGVSLLAIPATKAE
jgi:hypothetical protein